MQTLESNSYPSIVVSADCFFILMEKNGNNNLAKSCVGRLALKPPLEFVQTLRRDEGIPPYVGKLINYCLSKLLQIVTKKNKS